MKLSVAIISYNEATNIARTLTAVSSIADQIVIIDSHSTDDTLKIAKEFDKVETYSKDWAGYGLQKRYAIEKCVHPWILLLDADEEISTRLRVRIENIIAESDPIQKVYRLRFECYMNGELVRFGGWSNMKKIALFLKDSGEMSDEPVHPFWETTLPIKTIKEPVNHYTYRDIHHHLDKINTFTTDQAKSSFERKGKISYIKVLLMPKYYFLQMYIFRVGFLDGKNGLYMAVMNFVYFFVKYSKRYQLGKVKK